ncbi:MAG: glutamate--tRNA ligase [Lachnospiraceae bacterium]|nr:glutamate--tRNA ligase [Lachnospiraceae bacterium]
MQNPFWAFVGKLVDVLVLHLFWIVCSLPIVTFGPSTTALYYALMRLARDEGGHYYRAFFKSFKENIKQGIILGLIFLLIEGALAYTYWLCTKNVALNPAFPGIRIVAIILMVVVVMTFEYAFPLLARFDNTIRRTIQNAFLMSIRHIGWTIVMTAIFVGFYALIIAFERYIFPLTIWGFGLVAFLQSYILNRIFKPYIEKITGKEENDPDAWTLPEEDSEAAKEDQSEKELPMTKIKTRFAPSPTGRMHVGNLRTALYAYLIAKHEGGDFLLRIEDTDQGRLVEGAVDIIYRTMKETGLIHDEGPDKDGGCGPYVQSERMAAGIYMEYAKKLIEKGEAYYCFCDEERLNTLKTKVGEDGKEIRVYDKHCLHLSKEEIEANLKAGKPFVIRQNNPTTGTTTFHDDIYGDITVDNAELDDMVLIKSDGYPTYNFANVVDDHLMGITHVVRGNEYLSSSPKYNRLYDAFGWEVPVYVHCPLITDEEHKKLSKRSGHSSFEDLIEQGFLTEAVVNFVALLGWSPEDNTEIMSLEELVEKFDYRRINKSPAVFDYAKLKWMNGEYIRREDDEKYLERALPIIRETVHRNVDHEKIAMMVKSRIETFREIPEKIAFFEEVPEYDVSLYENKKAKCDPEKALQLLKEVLPVLEAADDYTNDALFERLNAFGAEKEYKMNFVMWPIRTALSGLAMTPGGATELLSVLGKEESLNRIRDAIAKLS